MGEKLGFFHDSAAKVEFFNPLGAALKCPLAIEYLDYRGKDWFVEDVQQYETDLGDKRYFLADYLLLSKDLKGGEERVKLRIVAGPKAMMLTKDRRDGVQRGVRTRRPRTIRRCSSRWITRTSRGQDVHEEYSRCGGVRYPYEAAVKSLRGDSFALKYWDYSRSAEIDGVQTEQYLYVEMLTANGYLTIWQGEEVDPQCIEVFATGGDAKK